MRFLPCPATHIGPAAAAQRLAFSAPPANMSAGGWRWTSHSPTGSGPEGSSPNELRFGSLVSLPHLDQPDGGGRLAAVADRKPVTSMAESSDRREGPNESARPPAPAYRVLARKYRPATFEDLIGQEAMVRTLSNAFETGRVPQAWILTGVRGVGKTTTARILARALNYQRPDGSG